MKSFQTNPYPGRKEKQELAKSLNTTPKAIANWFGNLRHKKSSEGILERSE